MHDMENFLTRARSKSDLHKMIDELPEDGECVILTHTAKKYFLNTYGGANGHISIEGAFFLIERIKSMCLQQYG